MSVKIFANAANTRIELYVANWKENGCYIEVILAENVRPIAFFCSRTYHRIEFPQESDAVKMKELPKNKLYVDSSSI